MKTDIKTSFDLQLYYRRILKSKKISKRIQKIVERNRSQRRKENCGYFASTVTGRVQKPLRKS